jgi:hypothetical protein
MIHEQHGAEELGEKGFRRLESGSTESLSRYGKQGQLSQPEGASLNVFALAFAGSSHPRFGQFPYLPA